MVLEKILDKISVVELKGSITKEIVTITNNSKEVEKGSAFFAIKGVNTDGVKFVDSAIENGAHIIFHETEIETFVDGITYVRVENLRKYEPIITSYFYGNPEKRIKLIGVTGTNGKTSTVSIIHHTLNRLGVKCGLVGTVIYDDGKSRYTPTHTTPDSFTLSKLFRSMVDNGCEYCVMEVSSHALVMNRVSHLKFDRTIFTNISQDHLDFHTTMEEYAEAKSILLNQLIKDDGIRVISKPVNYSDIILSEKRDSDIIIDGSTIMFDAIEQSSEGISFYIKIQDELIRVESPIFGHFQAENLGLSYLTIKSMGLGSEKILNELKSFDNIPGRMERVSKDKLIFVDYAHTPEALEKLLETATLIPHNKIITVFGCGGDRDSSKRAIMGRVGTALSDLTIITDDNPRFEDRFSILNDIEEGVVRSSDYKIIPDRGEAICEAIEVMGSDDILVIAGKGHETYQDIKGVKIDFSDSEVVKRCLDDISR